MIVEQYFAVKHLVAAVVYSGLGIGILFVATFLFDLLTPGKLWVEIVEHKNQPLAIVVAALILAVGLIAAAGTHG